MSIDEICREQEYVSMLYGRLDDLRAQLSDRMAQAFQGSPGGTHQARHERDITSATYAEQVARCAAVEPGLCFGRLDLDGGERRYVGRIGLFSDSGDYEPLLIDWRAPAARPFYVATAASPEGVRRRRHIRTAERRVVDLADEVLDIASADPNRHEGLTGEAALLAAVNANRTGVMQDIVETIQAEQDRIIRAPMTRTLVVQGGPGTGKTAVALHRAAFLLYTYREQLASRAVLIIGPNPTFLRYIGEVLPSLGETSIVLATVGDLYPGLQGRRAESARVAEIKGRLAMADVITTAIADREQLPDDAHKIVYDDRVLRLERATCAQARDRARRSRWPHNYARVLFAEFVIDALARQYVDQLSADILVDDLIPDPAQRPGEDAEFLLAAEDADAPLLNTDDVAEIRRDLRAAPAVAAALDELWPTLTPARLLDDLFADPDRLASAAADLTDDERGLLWRAAGGGWSAADVPLLDEAADQLGIRDSAGPADAAAAELEREEYARGVLEILEGSRSLDDEEDPEMLMAQDLINAGRLASRHVSDLGMTVAERAAADRRWAYGHVIVDEAQELSEMAWRVLMRRCPSHSMTIVGDLAQTGDLAGASSWQHFLGRYLADRWALERLTVNYRMPAEIMAVAADVLRAVDPALDPPSSVRHTGVPPWHDAAGPADLPDRLVTLVDEELEAAGPGRLAVIVPAARVDELGAAVATGVAVPVAVGEDPELTSPVVVLGVRQAKGLEFDSVILVDPADLVAESPRGLNDLYVALTRATQRLGVVHTGPLPAALARLANRRADTARTGPGDIRHR